MVGHFSRPTASLKTRRFVYGVMLFCVANYLAHLFPVSLMSKSEWLSETLRAEHSDLSLSELSQAIASFEFFLVTIILLIVAELLALFVVLREGFRLCTRGWDGLTMNRKEYLMVVAGPVMFAGIPLMLLFGSAEAFVGTRAEGMAIHTLMFLTALLTTSIMGYIVGFFLEPKAFRDPAQK